MGCTRLRWVEAMGMFDRSSDRAHDSTDGTASPLDATGAEMLWYVNVWDIDRLASIGSTGYIACTSEKIFAEKPQLYDVYVDGQNVVVTDHDLQLAIGRPT